MVSLVPAMPLILAVEPDRKQAEAVETLARGVLRSEVVVTDSADGAIAVLAKRVPDLVLTSLLLPPKDEARILERLRELDAAGSYVQTLVIPMLAASNKKASESKRRLWKSRGSNSAPDGCAPEVFAGQISEYLRRAAVESVSRARAAKAELDSHQETATAADTAGLASSDGSHRRSAAPPSSHAPETDGIATSGVAAALEAAAAKQLLADRQTPKRRSPVTLDHGPTAGTSDLIKPAYAARPSPEPPQHEPSQRIAASSATGSTAPSDRLDRPLPPKPQEPVSPEPRPSVSERLSRLAAPKPVVVPPEPSRTAVDRTQGAPPRRILVPEPPRRVLAPDPPRRVLIPDPPQSPPEARHEAAPSHLQPPVAPRVESPRVVHPAGSTAPNTNKVTTAPSAPSNRLNPGNRSILGQQPNLGNQSSLRTEPNPRPPVDKVTQTPASAAESEPERSGARQKVVLGALDIGAFVQELTAAKGSGTSNESATEENLPPAPTQTAAVVPPKRQPVATQEPLPPAAEQTPLSGNGPTSAAAPAEHSRGARPQTSRRAGQDDWGIFDPQQAGFAALFAKLEEITDPDDPGKDPPT